MSVSFAPRRRGQPARPRTPARRGALLRLRLRIALARYRRGIVAGLLAVAVVAGLQALRPAAPATTPVLVVTRDLPAGHRLGAGDLAVLSWPGAAVPAGLVARPQGRVLAAPLRRGEPVTDVRVVRGRPAATGLPSGWVATTVRLTDPAAAFLVSPGDRVEVIAGGGTDPLGAAGPGSGGGAPAGQVLVDDAVVLTTPPADRTATDPSGAGGESADGSSGGLLGAVRAGPGSPPPGAERDLPAGVLVLGVPDDGAVALAAAGGVRYLTIARQIPPNR